MLLLIFHAFYCISYWDNTSQKISSRGIYLHVYQNIPGYVYNMGHISNETSSK